MSGCAAWFVRDAVARIVSEGLVGAKLVELTPEARPGSPTRHALAGTGRDDRLMQKAAASLARLDAATVAAEKVCGSDAIAASIHQGEGSLGKLIRDDRCTRA